MGVLRALTMATLLALAAGCGELGGAPAPDTAADSTPPAVGPTPAPALYLPVTEPDHHDPVARSGAAGPILECAGAAYLGSTSSNFGGPSTGGATPEEGLELFASQGLFQVPREGYREAARDAERVLYVFEADGLVRVAVILSSVRSDQAMHESGWGIETFAMCDPSEFGLPEDHPLMAGVWTGADGKPQPTSQIHSSTGPEHCDWQTVTFLTLGKRQFVRDPEGKLTAEAQGSYDGDARLPDDAEDTGYRRAGVALWRVPSGDAVYAVDGQRVERWPALREMIGCA